MEKPITFANRNDYKLFGMMYLPEPSTAQRVGILISVNAIKYRIGTFRMHVLLARQLCQLGYTVFTFDPQGIGDSEGSFEYKLLSEHYYDIQTGKYDTDLEDAIGYFREECQLGSLVLFGLCGGAISVLKAAAEDTRVNGLILLNIPVLVENLQNQGEVDNAAKITSSKTAGRLIVDKGHRLIELNFWLRLITARVNLREELKLLRRAAAVLITRVLKKIRGSGPTNNVNALNSEQPVSRNDLFNMHFQRAFVKTMQAQKQVLFVFAELDPWTWIFKSEFSDSVFHAGNPFETLCQIKIVSGSNHIFSDTASRLNMQKLVIEWLTSRYCTKPLQLRTAI